MASDIKVICDHADTVVDAVRTPSRTNADIRSDRLQTDSGHGHGRGRGQWRGHRLGQVADTIIYECKTNRPPSS